MPPQAGEHPYANDDFWQASIPTIIIIKASRADLAVCISISRGDDCGLSFLGPDFGQLLIYFFPLPNRESSAKLVTVGPNRLFDPKVCPTIGKIKIYQLNDIKNTLFITGIPFKVVFQDI